MSWFWPKQSHSFTPRRKCWNSNCCFFCFFYCIILFIVFLLAFTTFWLIFSPQKIKFTVTDATLTQFNFTNTTAGNNTLHYNLALGISIRNSNKKVGVYYRRIQPIAYYGKTRFAMLNSTSTPFYQGRKNTSTLSAVFEGQQVLVLGKKEISKYNEEKVYGVYNIDVKFGLRMKARYGKIKTAYYKPPKVDCQLRVPLSGSNGASPVRIKFNATECGSARVFPISVGIEIGPLSIETG